MARNARQVKLLELIKENEIQTQEELVVALQNSGFEVTQATVSRDIKELDLVKINIDGHRQKYACDESHKSSSSKFEDMFRHSVLSIDYANNLIVIKTLSGSANAAAIILDRIHNSDILGSIAGDDTVLVVVRTNDAAVRVVEQLKEIAFN